MRMYECDMVIMRSSCRCRLSKLHISIYTKFVCIQEDEAKI